MTRLILPALAVVLLLASLSGTAKADNPVQLSLFDPIQLVKNTDNVNGIRLNLIYSKNANVSGFDFAFIFNHTTGHQLGFQMAMVGKVEGNFTGAQWTLAGLVDGKMTGMQWAFYNSAGQMSGLQLGLVNTCKTAYGLQLGLINIIEKGGFMPFFPIFNFAFE